MSIGLAPTLTATGASGELRHGYQVAARFGAWTLTLAERTAKTMLVTVSNEDRDAYWGNEWPQSLRLHVGSRLWVWPDAERIDDTHYRVIGDPEVQ
jgi:hypothetical protein